ncbi:MAG: hypothetical protein NZ960_08245 [Candidatus Kapabacteria bacterium]|nr:hypothetical protein [Candidatus Kapabacteria bacterium]MDW8012444.1 hypothetical protein [Bacteroidota bacterium]
MPYNDNPNEGHPDVRTDLPGVCYFFLGNGLSAAAIQYSPQVGTPLGIALLDPEHFGPKRAALNFHAQRGISDTQLALAVSEQHYAATSPQVEWDVTAPVPTVKASWSAGALWLWEEFFYPDLQVPRLLRLVRLRNEGQPVLLRVWTGVKDRHCQAEFQLGSGEERRLALEYVIQDGKPLCRWTIPQGPAAEAVEYWNQVHQLRCSEPFLEHLFRTACWQLPATISVSGRMDASIWQYNLEWVRDHCMNVFGLLNAGHHAKAQAVLERVLTALVQGDGAPWDSSRPRPPELVELDQNGVLLAAVDAYVGWTGDVEFVRRWWRKLAAVAEYPFRFRAERAFLVHNAREYWERMPLHGVEDGFELAYQVWLVTGWKAAARLAERVGDSQRAVRWETAALRMQRALLFHPRYRLVANGCLIKRRRITGEVQWELHPQDHPAIPQGVPLRTEERHWLNPDVSVTLPIIHRLIPPNSALAHRTMEAVEQLWNQRWEGGGYGRYHISSEPDSPGPWPLASLLVARAYAAQGRSNRVWRVLQWLASLPQARSGSWFEFYGPRPVPPCPQVGILLWNWSELLQLLVCDIAGVWVTDKGLHIGPWLPDGVEWVELECSWRGLRRCIRVQRGDVPAPKAKVDGVSLLQQENGVLVPEAAVEVEVLLPAHYGKIPSWK